MDPQLDRRRLLSGGALAVAGAISAFALPVRGAAEAREKDTEAIADLMQEHGLLRRTLLVCGEAAARLTAGKPVPADALSGAASLFRSFGEDYHERLLEEHYVFPAVAPALKKSLDTAKLTEVLVAQHERGRAITDFALEVTRGGSVSRANGPALALALSGLVLMYERHTAIEETVVFPAWKNALPAARYQELSQLFEKAEEERFGKDGFEDALKRVQRLEQAFGIADPAHFTPPPPPRPAK